MNNINQNHYGKGDNINGDKTIFNVSEKKIRKRKIFSMDNPFIYIIVFLILTLITTYFINNKNNQMNVSQTHFGTGDNVGRDKIININPTHVPVILEKRFLGSSSYQDGYKTQFVFTIGFPSEDKFPISINNPNALLIDKPILQNTGTRTYSTGPIPYKGYLISIFTKEKLPANEFDFSIN